MRYMKLTILMLAICNILKITLALNEFPLHDTSSNKNGGQDTEPKNNKPVCGKCHKMYRLSQGEYERFGDVRTICIRLLQIARCIKRIKREHGECMDGSVAIFALGTGTNIKLKLYECSKKNINVNEKTNIVKEQRNKHDKVRPGEMCQYKQTDSRLSEPKHCGMFGDPHLKTFSDQRQTCVVTGAWSLLDNPHLAIQATNNIVQETQSSSATATSKISIVVKESNPSCIGQKIYQATSAFIPKLFRDGTGFTGPELCRTTISKSNENEVLLKICHINTTIVIRRVGKYLTFNMKMPFQYANASRGLCHDGCPASEQIDYESFFKSTENYISTESSPNKKGDAMNICDKANLTDFYYDSCVFDIMSTGDKQFAEAASLSLYDAKRLDKNIRLRRENSVILNEIFQKEDFVRNEEIDISKPRKEYNKRTAGSSNSIVYNKTLLLFLPTFLILLLRS